MGIRKRTPAAKREREREQGTKGRGRVGNISIACYSFIRFVFENRLLQFANIPSREEWKRERAKERKKKTATNLRLLIVEIQEKKKKTRCLVT